MPSILKTHQPCPICGSHDALTIYDDHSYCFSFSIYTRDEPELTIPVDYTFQYVPWRGVTADTMKAYDVRTKVNEEGKPIAIGFTYTNGRTKVRSITEKQFYTTGEATESRGYLFGLSVFASGSAKAITVT